MSALPIVLNEQMIDRLIKLILLLGCGMLAPSTTALNQHSNKNFCLVQLLSPITGLSQVSFCPCLPIDWRCID